jgi:hypothetical protein
MALECCILIEKWMQSNYSITSGNKNVFEGVHNILYSVQEAYRDTAYRAVIHVLVRATHIYKGYNYNS